MNKLTAKEAHLYLLSLADPAIAEHSQRFFKTGKGEYGEGDRFLGIRVPKLRSAIRQYQDMPHVEVLKLLRSELHEERLFSLLLLTRQFERSDTASRALIAQSYLNNTQYIDNWDLVDSSAHKIIGEHLLDKSRQPLYRLAKSENLWERRIAIIATLRYIKGNDFADTLKISRRLLHDDEDLIHKAVGWMLREVGNRDRAVEEAFLQRHYHDMPRTMLRYAIEKLPQVRRQQYLKGLV